MVYQNFDTPSLLFKKTFLQKKTARQDCHAG